MLILGIMPHLAYSADISTQISEVDLDFTLNQPKDSTTPSELTRTVRFTNNDNLSTFQKIENLNVEIEGNVTGLSATISPTKMSILYGFTEEAIITFKADQKVLETEKYGPFTLTISGTNLPTRPVFPLYLNIYYPEPTINATWGETDWGNIRAGSRYKKVLSLSEVMGYRGANNVNVSLATSGPITLNYSGVLGDIQPFGKIPITVDVIVDEKGLEPDSYQMIPTISSGSNIKANTEVAIYSIPLPKLDLSTTRMDFGRMTFERGKDISNYTLIVSETGNFTPIEGVKFSLIFGPQGWFSLPGDTSISPGESREFKFINLLPSDAKLGEKNWQIEMDSTYGGKQEIDAKALIYFPGIEAAIEYMNGLDVSGAPPEAETIRTNVLRLLEEAKGQTEVDEIALVMRIYSSSRSFLNIIDEASNPENQRAGRAIIQARESLNKIQLGNDNIREGSLNRYSSVIFVSSQDIWEKSARESLDRIRGEAVINEEINYKLSAINYKELAQIYSSFQETENQQIALSKQMEMEEKYKNRVLEANQRYFNSQDQLEKSRSALLFIGDFGLLLNPFKYDMVFANYYSALENMQMADRLFLVAGESTDSVAIARETLEVKKEREVVFNGFVVFYTVIMVLYLWFILRVSLGVQRFHRDQRDNILGDVLLKVRK